MKRTSVILGIFGCLFLLGFTALPAFSQSQPLSPRVFIKYTWPKENFKSAYSVAIVHDTISKTGSSFLICKGSHEGNNFDVVFSFPSQGRDYIRLSSQFRQAGDYRVHFVFDGEMPLPLKGKGGRSEITIGSFQPEYQLTITVFTDESEFTRYTAFVMEQIKRDGLHPNMFFCD